MSLPRTADAVVVGAGIIGCSCAYFLAKAGRRVAVFDAGAVGGATAAASGSGVLCHTKSSPLLIALTRRSMALYEALRAEAGVPYLVAGSYVVYQTPEEETFVRDRLAWLGTHDVRVQMVGREELARRLPQLAPSARGASHAPDDGSVQGTDAARALAAAAARLGASVHPHCRVEEMHVPNGRVRGVRTPAGTVECETIVLAAGPWVESLAAQVGVRVPIRLEKGETLLTQPLAVSLPGRVMSAGALAAKFAAGGARARFSVGLAIGQDRDGAIRIGATREEAGFDLAPTVRARDALLAEFARFFPTLTAPPIREHAVGLRPTGPDKRPVVARCADPAGLVLACGHGGDGIALAPITGRLVAGMIAGDPVDFAGELAVPAAAAPSPKPGH